jgi:hypothetical protein
VISVCSYCRQVIGEKEPYENKMISHGICTACWDYHMPKIEELSFSTHLDQYDSPVIMVDAEGRVIGINTAMTSFLRTTREQSLGLLGGELMRCRHACLPEGCGNTIHCSTCVIRQTFTRARNDNRDLLKIPACLDQFDQRLRFLISAYNRAEFVKVIVDELTGVDSLPVNRETNVHSAIPVP